MFALVIIVVVIILDFIFNEGNATKTIFKALKSLFMLLYGMINNKKDS